MKKIMSTILIFALLLPLLGGCAQDTQEAYVPTGSGALALTYPDAGVFTAIVNTTARLSAHFPKPLLILPPLPLFSGSALSPRLQARYGRSKRLF